MKFEDYEKIAKYHELKLSEKAPNIIRVKEMLGVGIRCPCEPDNKKRYCGSETCVRETRLVGKCHCGMFLFKESA